MIYVSNGLSFYRSQNFLCQTKIYLHIVGVTNILCPTKRWFAFSKIVYCDSTKVFEEALNAVKFLGWLKKFGPAQNILGPVKGQGINPPNPWLSYFSLNFNGTLGLNNKDSKTNHTWALSIVKIWHVFCNISSHSFSGP